MLEETFKTLYNLCNPTMFFFFFLPGIFIGIILGVLPGVSGMTGMVLLLPYVTMMTPDQAMVILLTLSSVSSTGGSLTSILFGVPGDTSNAATILDGYSLAKKGQAAYAMGASLTSAALAGILGAILLYGLIPVVKPIVLSFGSPEFFFMILLGVSCIALVGASDAGGMVRGLVSGGLGLLLSLVGTDVVTGEARFTLGTSYLLDGIPISVAALGAFAMAEMISLTIEGKAIAEMVEGVTLGFRQVLDGFFAVFRKWRAFLLGSAAGAVVGILPGIGGNAGCWIGYGLAKQMSRTPELFGNGAIEGVIAPEAANHSTKGGDLLPTLAFGIPGSVSMSIILAGLTMKGIEVGPRLLIQHANLLYSMVWVLVIGNVFASLICLIAAKSLAKVTFMRPSILVPLILALVGVGAIGSRGILLDIIVVSLFSFIGYTLKLFRFSRAALVVGLILGEQAERNLQLSLQAYGPQFFLRPISLIIIALIILLILHTLRSLSPRRKTTDGSEPKKQTARPKAWIFSAVILVVLISALLMSLGYAPRARMVPLIVAIPTLLGALSIFFQDIKKSEKDPHEIGEKMFFIFSLIEVKAILWILGLSVSILIFGYTFGIVVYTFLFMKVFFGEKVRSTLIWCAILGCFTYGMLTYILPGVIVYKGIFQFLG
jgi:putative tricarboxylic transport membrane protein